ncbi:MAG: sodium:alanine symporter family protein [Omnitrophica bacterium]|nr:sodium:alanine symporter family protein [Candidatus Omnitrophota bacterium]
MSNMYAEISGVVSRVSSYVWGPVLMALLLGTGIYFTIRLRFVQVREFFHGWKITLGFFEHPKHKGEIKHFQALSTALSATVGTGNIAGVATAIALGGPGAVVWMWLTGFFGMALKYASSVLALKYRVIGEDGSVAGGPMYYLSRGLGIKWLAVLFAFCAAITATVIGNMVQSNSVADVLHSSLQIPHLFTGICIAIFVWLVIVGGIKRIAGVAQVIAPVMCVIYITGALYVILANMDKIAPSFLLIIKHAFTPMAATGGFAGSVVLYTMRMGIARGLFSNEAGLGSAPIAHAAVKENEPVREGLVAMLGPFIDTLIICTLTALVIIISGKWSSGLTGATLTANAFRSSMPFLGDFIVTFGLIFFALSTIIAWSYYGDRCVYYLFGEKAVKPYKWIYCCLIPLGAWIKLELVWNLADITNAFMALPNLIGLIGLSGVVIKLTESYNRKLRIARRLHKTRWF